MGCTKVILTLIGIHTLSGEGNTAFLGVNVLDLNLDNVACLEELGGVLDVLITHLGDVKKSVVVNSNINEATEVNNVSYSTLKLHIGLKVVDVKNLGGEYGSGSVVTNVASGLLKLGDNVLKGGLTATKLLCKLCNAVLLSLEAEKGKVVSLYVLCSEAESLEKILCNCVGLGGVRCRRRTR